MQRIGLAALARRLLPWIVVLVASLVTLPAMADPANESAAKALQKKAIEEDFLNLDYDSAIKKLQAAATKCEGGKCSSTVKATVLRDLGAMQILAGNEGDGRASFGQAIALESSLDLDPAYKNPQLDAIWSDVKAGGAGSGGGGGTGAGGGGGGGGAEGGGGGGRGGGGARGGGATPSAPPPAGDFAHTPAVEEVVRTPLPIYAEYTGEETLSRVMVKYKGAGMSEWRTLELKKTDDGGWAGLIPCKDVMQGSLRYYIQGLNSNNDRVASSGSRTKPYVVPVKSQIEGEPPALPGEEPPAQCGELAGAECPPDFPGCNSKKASGEDCERNSECRNNTCVSGKCGEKKSGGEECSSDDECTSDTCSDGKCSESKKGEGEDCESGDECDSGACKEGKCTGSSKGPKVFLGVAVSLDFNLVPGANDVCVLNGWGHATVQPGDGTGPFTAGNPYTCLDASNNVFPGLNPAANNLIHIGQGDQVVGGFARGPLSLLVSLDYAVSSNVMLGIRAGYEALTIPTGASFAPIRAEARLTYLFGRNAVNAKLAPLILVGGGVGEFDSMVPIQVYKIGSPTVPYNFNAAVTAGPGFGTAGLGLRYKLSKRAFMTGAAKLQGAFGGAVGFMFGFVPEIGIQYGF